MAKMTDKKPAKAKTKVKVKASTAVRKRPPRRAARHKTVAPLIPEVRQPGVEPPQEPSDAGEGRAHAGPLDPRRAPPSAVRASWSR